MTAPNMATITESLERSLQNFSLNHERRSSNSGGGGGGDGGEDGLTRRSSTSDDNNNNSNHPITVSDTSLELNSHLSLPYHWEQCLDLKTGEIYYINWRNGMKASEDPRTSAQYSGGDFYSEEEEDEDEDDDDDSSYDSEESPSESSFSTREKGHCNSNNNNRRAEKDKDNVLVVAGCKSCLMYFMVPKQVEDCPKCNGQLLHFDRSETSSP
ncbi:hypothetical protein like AT2G33510 [Hibiscus trionum]|uniref:WW domain-containing protein n=1 Tax=Hibiscus trionum TaxID=183268 RepID=A0A9W7HLW2_HIBTR|nr:hypothetical protein like AT2G33510 [Hibiscus trionum]